MHDSLVGGIAVTIIAAWLIWIFTGYRPASDEQHRREMDELDQKLNALKKELYVRDEIASLRQASKLLKQTRTGRLKSTVLRFHDSLARPPNLGCYILYIFLNKSDRETIPGDLAEEFTTIILPKFGPGRAWAWYWAQVIRTIAYRNQLCRWLLIGGGVYKLEEWITRKIGG
jgi:hypothetical protein